MNLQQATIYEHAAFYRESLSPLTSTRQPQPDPGLRADAQTTRACWQRLKRPRLVCLEAQRRFFSKKGTHRPSGYLFGLRREAPPVLLGLAGSRCGEAHQRSHQQLLYFATLPGWGIPRPLHHRTRRGAAGGTFQLPDGRHVGPPSVPVRYALCSRVFNNSERGCVAMCLSLITPYQEDPLLAMVGGVKFNASGESPHLSRT